MKTPDEIKKGLECCEPGWRCGHFAICTAIYPYRVESVFCRTALNADALAYIQQLEAQIPKWVSVDKRKPKRGEYVLFLYAKDAQNPVMHAKNPMVVGRYDYGMYLANGCEVKITHWMPLPELPTPPKEDDYDEY